MRYGLIIAEEHDTGKLVVFTGLELLPYAEAKAKMRHIKSLPHHEEYCRFELVDVSAGRARRKRMGKPPVTESVPAVGVSAENSPAPAAPTPTLQSSPPAPALQHSNTPADNSPGKTARAPKPPKPPKPSPHAKPAGKH